MTHEIYVKSLELMDVPLDALIMAAMRKADEADLIMLRSGWPDIYNELQKRKLAVGGMLEGESPW